MANRKKLIIKKNTHWVNHAKQVVAWIAYNALFAHNYSYWSSTTSKVTSMGLGSQKGFIANPVNAPNITS